MLLWSVLGVVALLVAGWYGRDVLQLARLRTSRWQMRRRRERMLRERTTALNWVVRYYHVDHPNSALFRLPNGRLLPYLSSQRGSLHSSGTTALASPTATSARSPRWINGGSGYAADEANGSGMARSSAYG